MSQAPDPSNGIDAQFQRYGPAYRWLVTVSGMAGAMTMVLSATMVNVAVPSIMGAFGVGQDLAQWAATGFIATMVASQLLNAWMTRALGRRVTYTLTLALFTLGSVICAVTPNIDMLILGRVLQGFSAGVIQPLVMTTIVEVFPEKRRGFAVGLYGMGVTLSPSFGPLCGGLVIDAFTWRHIFIAPLPLVFFSVVMGLTFMPRMQRKEKKLPPFDWTGFILVAVALFCLMTALGNGRRLGWGSDQTLILAGVGFCAAVLFIHAELRAKAPILDPTLFLNSRFAAATLIGFAFGAGNFATNYAIPVFVQTVQGYTATKAGLVLVPAGLFLFMLIFISGKLADNLPPQYPIMAGCCVFATAAWLMSGGDVNTPYWSMALFTVLSRGAIGLVMPNIGAAAMRAAPPEKLSLAAGATNFIRQLGGAFGVNMTVVIIETRTAFHADGLTATQTSANPFSVEMLDKVRKLLHESGVAESELHSGALNYLGKVVHAQATTFGFQDAFLCISVVFVVALIPAWILGRTK